MSKSYNIITKVGVSTVSFSDAVRTAVEEEKNAKAISWFEVVEQRGRIDRDGKVEFQVTVKLGYRDASA